jgi:hypothetical protein
MTKRIVAASVVGGNRLSLCTCRDVTLGRVLLTTTVLWTVNHEPGKLVRAVDHDNLTLMSAFNNASTNMIGYAEKVPKLQLPSETCCAVP